MKHAVSSRHKMWIVFLSNLTCFTRTSGHAQLISTQPMFFSNHLGMFIISFFGRQFNSRVHSRLFLKGHK